LDCLLYIKEENKFIRNEAEHEGGGLIWVNVAPIDDGTTLNTTNAAPYGSFVASFPMELHYEFITSNDPQDLRGRLLDGHSGGWEIVSGIPFELSIIIKDQLNQTYSTENTATAALAAHSSSIGEPVVLLNSEVQAKGGIFNFTNILVTTKPGSTASKFYIH